MRPSPVLGMAALLVLLAGPAQAEPDPVALVDLALDALPAASSSARVVSFRADGRVEVHGSFGDRARGTATDVLAGKLTPDELITLHGLLPALSATTRLELPRSPSDVALTVTTKSGRSTSYSHAAGQRASLLSRAGHAIEAAFGAGDRLDAVTGLPTSVLALRDLSDAVTKRLAAKLVAPTKFDRIEIVVPDYPSRTDTVRLDASGDTTVNGSEGTVAVLTSEQVGKLQDLFRRADFARLPVVPSNLGVSDPSPTRSSLRVNATWSLGGGVTATRSVFVAMDQENGRIVPRLEAASAEAAPLMGSLAALGEYATVALYAGDDARKARARIANDGVVPGVDYVSAPLFPHPGDRERMIAQLKDQADKDDARIESGRTGFLDALARER